MRDIRPNGLGTIQQDNAPLPVITSRYDFVRTEATRIGRTSRLRGRYIEDEAYPNCPPMTAPSEM